MLLQEDLNIIILHSAGTLLPITQVCKALCLETLFKCIRF